MFGRANSGDCNPPEGIFGSLPTARLSVDCDRIESVTVGTLESDGGKITISYEETIDTEAPPVNTKIEFDMSDPTKLVLTRKGLLSSAICFDRGNYRFCQYITPLMPFELCIYTRKLENGITEDGGRLVLDYATELKGTSVQRITMTVEVTRIK